MKYVYKFGIFTDAKLIRKNNISGKKKLCLFFSYRHLMSLPVRGQRTKTNAKTRKDFQIF